MLAISPGSSGAPAPGPSRSAALNLLTCIEDILQRISQRHELAKLADADLKDLGWTRTDVLQELEKPFWR